MKNLFVPFDIAKKLKIVGFNELCLAFYYNNGDITQFNLGEDISGKRNVNLSSKDFVAAPLWQQVIDWLREEKGIHFEIIESNGIYSFTIKWHNGTYYNVMPLKGDKYYPALQSGIEKALELI